MDKSSLNVKKLLGWNLKRLRSIAKKSQLELANEADLAPNFINGIEKGEKWISAKTLEKLAVALNVEPKQFFDFRIEGNKEEREIISGYLNDFSNSIVKMVEEHTRRYFTENFKTKDK